MPLHSFHVIRNNYDTPHFASHGGFFLGYGYYTAVMICHRTKTKRIIHCCHAIIDDHGATLQASDHPLTRSEYMLRYYPTVESDSSKFRAQLLQLEIKPSDLDFVQSPFDAGKCISLEVILPPKGTDYGLTFGICQISLHPSLLMFIHYLPSDPIFL